MPGIRQFFGIQIQGRPFMRKTAYRHIGFWKGFIKISPAQIMDRSSCIRTVYGNTVLSLFPRKFIENRSTCDPVCIIKRSSWYIQTDGILIHGCRMVGIRAQRQLIYACLQFITLKSVFICILFIIGSKGRNRNGKRKSFTGSRLKERCFCIGCQGNG